MTKFTGPPAGAIRNKPISGELEGVLEVAARTAGVDVVRITSGGQDALGEGTRRTGSTRHDHGRAADLQLVVGGATLSFSDRAAPDAIVEFCTAAAAAGATGIGAGVGYMGDRTIHVGFGTSAGDTSRLTWGAGGLSANAPAWLRDAARAGWSAPTPGPGRDLISDGSTGRRVVLARGGLKLRGGPGTRFDAQRTLPAGTELIVVGLSETDPSWARVSLGSDDALVDGYVFASFLGRPEGIEGDEGAPEPGDAEAA